MADVATAPTLLAPTPATHKTNPIWTILFVVFFVMAVLYFIYLIRIVRAPRLRYTTPNTFTKDEAITNLSPTATNFTPTAYVVSPALPTGLSLNSSTGVISGTPSVAQAAANYTILATNTTTSACYKISIRVVE